MKKITNKRRTDKPQSSATEPIYCSIPHAAQMLGVGLSTVQKLIRDGQIKAVRYSQNTHPRVVLASVNALLEGRS